MDTIESGKGPVRIVAVHGIQGTRDSWLGLVERMAGEASFVLPNLRGRAAAVRGHGPGDYRLACYADDLQEVIGTYVGSEPFYLAGWSMGVSVSLEYLSRPDVYRPRGLILMSGTPMLDRASWFTCKGEALMAEIADRERTLGLVNPADRDAVAWTWEANSSTSHLHVLPSVKEPVLIVHGMNDTDSPWSHAGHLAKSLPNATLHGLPGVGHTILKEATDDVVRYMREFIARVEKNN